MDGVIDGAAEDGRGEIMPDQIRGEPPENLSPVAFSWGQWAPMEFMSRLRFWKGNSVWGWEWLWRGQNWRGGPRQDSAQGSAEAGHCARKGNKSKEAGWTQGSGHRVRSGALTTEGSIDGTEAKRGRWQGPFVMAYLPEATQMQGSSRGQIYGTGARRELTRAYTYILSHYPSQEALPIDRWL